jgi:hypothetical protein
MSSSKDALMKELSLEELGKVSGGLSKSGVRPLALAMGI